MVAGALASAAAWSFFLLPVVTPKAPVCRVVLDRDGRLLSARIAEDHQWRFPSQSEVPHKYAKAVVAFEDKRFWRHPGVDLAAVSRALWSNLSAGRVVSGASTLTMQVIRLARPGRPRSAAEKGVEALLALRLERSRSKEEILRLYASHAPFGGNLVGLEAAAWRMFGQPPDALTWAQAAMLAVLPNRPGAIHVGSGRSRLLQKRNHLLRELHEAGDIDEMTLRTSVREPLPQRLLPLPRHARHLLQSTSLGPEHWSRIWTTSIDGDLQRFVEAQANRHAGRLARGGIHNVAVVIASTVTGEILAYVGNATAASETRHSPEVDIAVAPRSTGSLLKPFLYAMQLDAGEVLPTQLLADVPIRFGGFGPENFDRRYRGAVPARNALARSLNVPAVTQLHRFGVTRFLNRLRRLGLRRLDRPAAHYGLSLILGGGEATLFELASLYGYLGHRASGSPQPWPGLHFGDVDHQAPPSDIITVGAAHLTLEALLDVDRPGVDVLWRSFAGSQPVSWKTGTSFGFRDGWAIGVSSGNVVAVWAGNADGEGRAGLTGFSAAAPLLFRMFDGLPRQPDRKTPWSALKSVEVCAHSGLRPGPHCGTIRQELVPRKSTPEETCPFCRTITCDSGCRHRVHARCMPLEKLESRSFFVLPPALAHFTDSAVLEELPPWHPSCRPDPQTSMACLQPKEGTALYVPVQLDGRPGRAVLEAVHARPNARIFWHLNGRYLGSTANIHQLEVLPEPGRQRLTLVDDRGETLVRHFTVLPPTR